jgi:hypothetical protein
MLQKIHFTQQLHVCEDDFALVMQNFRCSVFEGHLVHRFTCLPPMWLLIRFQRDPFDREIGPASSAAMQLLHARSGMFQVF